MKEKNYIFKSFLFVLIIALAFGILSFFDIEKSVFSYKLKPVNMFSDILTDEITEEDTTVIEKTDILPIVNSDSCPNGLICIQNFTSQSYPLDKLFTKLQLSKRGKGKVRVAWFGDSFTDADLIVCDLRDTLQSIYGGNGVGFVPITHEAAGYRRSVIHTFGGWNTSSVISRKGKWNFGINGFNYQPDSANFVRFIASKKFYHTRKFDIFRLFYSSKSISEAKVSFNDTVKQRITLQASGTPEMVTLGNSFTKKVKVNLLRNAGVTIFGASLEDSTGIYFDNFSIKGNSGLSLLAIPNTNLQKFDSLLQYDLVVLQFGLNAVTPESRKYTSYLQGMKRLVDKFKAAFPNTPILMLSVSDRSERKQGSFVTMKAIKKLVEAQEKFAYDNKLLFWNLYQAMGGENSMARFVQSNPPLASKDYTHLNFDGGKIIGHSLARSFIHEADKFTERRKNIVAN